MKLNQEVIQKIGENVTKLLSEYINELDEAYLKCDEKKFSITLGTKIEETDKSRFKVETSISFVKDKVKDSVTDYVDAEQVSFNFKEEVNV
mgnify:CR=1 FL=1